jgi:hypothetical protein
MSINDSSTMLAAYLPRHRLLFVADDAEGGTPSELLRTEVERLGLDVNRLATAHTGVHKWPAK